MINRSFPTSAIAATLAGTLVLAGLCLPAPAAPTQPAQTDAHGEPVSSAPTFPSGSRVGLVPPPGMIESKAFPGFLDPEAHAVILLGALPAAAYADIAKTATAQALKKQGVDLKKREAINLGFAKGTLLIGSQTAPDKSVYRKWLLLAPADDFTVLVTVQVPADNKAYPDQAIRTALASVALRGNIPAGELISGLPFKVGDLAGFRIANVIPRRAMLLVDAPSYPHMVATKGLPDVEYDGRLIVAAVPGGPAAGQEQSDFARLAFNTIGGIKDVQFTMSEPVRLDQTRGFETVAHAKDATTGSDLMVVQWLRFVGSDAFLQMVGISRVPVWERELSRLRTVRDSIVMK